MTIQAKTLIAFLFVCGFCSVIFIANMAQSPTGPAQALQQRVAVKIERVTQEIRQWEVSGRDTSVIAAIASAMEKKLKPFLDAGKFSEAEAELDRMLEMLDKEAKSTEVPTVLAQAANASSSAYTPHSLREIIVSYADETNKLQLYRVNEDGLARRRITDGTHNCLFPAWSPDGKKIVYAQEDGNDLALWLADSDGKHPKMLLGSGLNKVPSWAPDSKHIVWTEVTSGNSPFETGQLNIMNTETLELRRLFSDREQVKFSNMMPVISPDGTKVAFVSNRGGHYRIWLSKLDGSDARPISPAAADADETLHLPIEQKVPSWSPDGKWIAHWEGVEMSHLSQFTGKADPQRDILISSTWNVWVVGSDGKNKRKAGRGDDPTWSPDGAVTRSFPVNGGVSIMIERNGGWKKLPIMPAETPRYARFTWKP